MAKVCFLFFLGQKLLGVSQAEIKQKCQQRTKELEELKTAVDSLKVCFKLTCNSSFYRHCSYRGHTVTH